MRLIVTMAGLGTRMSGTHSGVPKQFIELNGLSLLEISMLGMPLDKIKGIIFIVRQADFYQTEELLESIPWLSKVSYQLIGLTTPTIGQAQTALVGIKSLGSEEPFLIMNCDTFISGDIDIDALSEADGAIFTFYATSPDYSYVVSKNNFIESVAEKLVISNRASNGLYYFKNKNLYLDAYNKYETDQGYVAPLYVDLINSGRSVLEVPAEYSRSIGTSEEFTSAKLDVELLEKINASLHKKLYTVG